MKELELLSPVGKMESLYAAIENGANAVYLGGKLFNARHYASNFTDEEMLELVNYAHLRDVRVYVTMNILLDQAEIEPALDYAKYLYDIGVDALIVQDLGFAYLLGQVLPKLALHGSTQMTINNSQGAQLLYENGFKRVVLARETPIEEIRKIKASCPIELEVFIHGALCVSYSGQCLMSSMIGGRSGNRGRCAQPCRMPSSLVNDLGIPVEAWENQHILSPKDLNTVEEIEELIQAGVVSFKIEGRMKRPEYVATVTRVYRKALDFGSENIDGLDKKELEQIFNRGFTKGVGFGDFGQDFISYDRPDNRGLFLGKVLKVARETMAVKLEMDLAIGDDLELQFGQDNYRGMKSTLAGVAGDVVELKKLGPVKMGQKIYKKSSMELLDRAQASYAEDTIKKDIDISLDLGLGDYPRIEIRLGDMKASYELEEEIQASKNKPLEEARVREQISKLGDTVYRLRSLDLRMDENIFMPVAQLNQLRRQALEKLDRLLLDQDLAEKLSQEDFNQLKKKALATSASGQGQEASLAVQVDCLEMVEKLDLSDLARIYINTDDLEEVGKILDHLDPGLETYLSTEKILYQKDLDRLGLILDSFKTRLDGVAVANLGSLNFVAKNYDLKIHGDTGLNIFNSYGLEFLSKYKVTSCNLSPELNLRQIEKICDKAVMEVSTIVYGHLLVMVTKHCPMSLAKGCKNDQACRSCQYRLGYSIRDRIGAQFKMIRKPGFTKLYNPGPIVILDDLDSLARAGINQFRLDFVFEEEANPILEKYKQMNNGEISISEVKDYVNSLKASGITKGHYFRGILD